MPHKLIIEFVIILVIMGITVSHMSAAVDTNTSDAWSHPSAKTIVRIGPAPDIPEQPNFLNNLDCAEIQYRDTVSGQLAAGCFTDTAFGMIDTDSGLVIFNGTDEALPLEAFSAHQVLVPWTRSGKLLTLDALNTGGSVVSMYKNVSAELINKRSVTGQLRSKQLSQPPDMTLRFSDGQALVINPQTLAFSSNGSWMIAETMRGAFVRINLATLEVTPFAQSYAALGNPAMLKSLVSVSDNGQFVAIANSYATSFRVYDLNHCTATLATIATNPCANFDYWPFTQTSVGTFSLMQHLRFVHAGLLSFELVQAFGKSTFLMAPTSSIDSLTNYIGLGDSYTSGEGAFDYTVGTDTTTNMCHLSVQSYPLILTRLLYGASGGHSAACSGAVINDITPKNPSTYRGQISDGVAQNTMSEDYINQVLADYTPGILSQQNYISHYQPSVITVGVGGNDIGFGNVLQNCVEPHISIHASDNTCFATYEDRIEQLHLIDATILRWISLYRQLAAQAPRATIYAIGYPQISVDTGKCGFNVHLSKSELEFAQELIDYLNTSIAKAAQAADVTYVDIHDALAGHRLCETSGYNSAVNGLTSGTDAGALGINFLGKESYHPNALGQQLIAEAILSRTDHFKTHQTSNPAPVPTTITDAPKTGRTIRHVAPIRIVANPILKKGDPIAVQISGQSVGLQPNTEYRVIIDTAANPPIGLITTDTNGDISSSINLPINAATGGTTIHVIGPSATDTETDASQPIYITENETDYDGDGQANTNDSCPYALNANVDADNDGIDDGCDPIIGASNTPNNEQPPEIASMSPNSSPPSSHSFEDAAESIPATTNIQPPSDTSLKPTVAPSVCTNCKVLGASITKQDIGSASVQRSSLFKLIWPWWFVLPLLVLCSIELIYLFAPRFWLRSRRLLIQKVA